MKIFVTGSTGYIGQKLALAAAEKGWTVHALVRNLNSKFIPVHPNIILFKGDIKNKMSIEKAMKGCVYVFHTAAFTKEGDDQNPEFEKVNVQGTQNVLHVALSEKIQRFVFTGSCSVYGPSDQWPISEENEDKIKPTTSYALSKYKAEKLVKEFTKKGLWSVIVFPTRIYGPGNFTEGNPITRLINNISKNKISFFPYSPGIKGNYAFVDDVVNGHFLALEKGFSGEKYFLGGEHLTYKKFFTEIRRLSASKTILIPVPKWILKLFVRIYYMFLRFLGKKPRVSPKHIDRIWENRLFSNQKAKDCLGFTTTSFEIGIQKTVSFLKSKNDNTDNRFQRIPEKIKNHIKSLLNFIL